MDFKVEDNCYVNNKFIGTTVCKKITVDILNPNNEINLENKEIAVQTGMIINGVEETVPFGNFIIEKPDTEEVKEKTSFTGYDYMIKFNTTYKNRVTYPISAGDLFEDVCEQADLEAGNSSFVNSNYMILGNPFTNNEDCRTVLSNIAQLAGGFARIGRDNKVYIISLKNISSLLKVKDVHVMTVKDLNATLVKLLSGGRSNAEETLDGNNYFEDFSKNEQWGEVNSLVLRISGIEGENTTVQDETSITTNGLTEVVIEDNYFLTDQAEREKAITPLWNAVKGIKYLPFKTEYYGYPYLDAGDLIYVQDAKDKGYVSYVFNHTFTFNGGYDGNLETPAMTKTQTAYKNTINSKTKFRQVERKIDKINGVIEDVIEQQTETTTKLTKVEQDIDSITQTVSSVEEQVDENNQSISQTNQKVTQIEQTVEGISQSVSNVEETIETVEQKADNAQSTADNINTNLTTNYYNKTETNSQINQKANEITSTVSQTYSTKTETTNAKNEAIESANSSTDEKLQDYSTTEEMNSAITQSATSITSEVNQTITNIQVGGTNAIRNSAPYNRDYWGSYNATSVTIEDESTSPSDKCIKTVLKSGNYSGIYNSTATYIKPLTTGVSYTYSVWLKASKNITVNVGYEQSKQAEFAVTTQWKKFTATFTFNALQATNNFIIYAKNAANGDILYVHSLKLEEGNKATAWSPSPDDDVKEYEFGTKIEQNAKNVQVAWNNESQNIRIENDNGNSTMGFYDNDTKFAEMGVNNVDSDRYISFAVPCNYNQSIADGMAWGIQTPDGAFHPILFIKNFHMGAQQSDDVYGELALRFCDLVLEGIESGIKSGNIKMYGNALNGLVFESDDGSQLLSINPPNSNIPEWENGGLNILGNIEFYKNAAGTCSLKMSNNNDSNYFLATNDGAIHCSILYISSGSNQVVIWSDGTVSGEITFYSVPYYQNHPLVYGGPGHIYQIQWTGSQLQFLVDNKNVTDNISDKRLKSDIKDVDEDLIKAINELEYKQFKRDNKGGLIGVGIIAQDLAEKLEKYGKKTDDYEILQQFQYKTDDDTLYYEVEDKQFLLLRLMAKEQEIKELQEKVSNQDEIIQNLLARVEKLEKEVKINE